MIKKILFLLIFSISPLVLAQESNNFSPLQPAALIESAPNNRYALISELDSGKLHIFERQQGDGFFRRVKTMAVSIGKEGYGKRVEGDNKTPVGVYRIVSHLTNAQLDDFYGHAAYPINYPNAWDRLHQRTGYGIWIHAEPVGFTKKTRPLRDSNGCVVLSNNDIDAIQPYLDIGYTYIVLTPKMVMTSAESITNTRKAIRQRLRAWEAAWESREHEQYMAFYSQKFNSLDKNWQQWNQYKKRVNGGKRFINVNISDLGIYRYPGEDNMLWVEYYQAYNSSNFKSSGWKRQLWKLEADGQWRIIYEGGG